MKFLAVGRLDPSLPRHKAQEAFLALAHDGGPALSLTKSGQVDSMYYNISNAGMVLILEVASVEAAEEMLQTIPSVQKGLTRFDLIEITPIWQRNGDTSSSVA